MWLKERKLIFYLIVMRNPEKWKPFKYRDYKEWRREQDKEQGNEAESRWREFMRDPYIRF